MVAYRIQVWFSWFLTTTLVLSNFFAITLTVPSTPQSQHSAQIRNGAIQNQRPLGATSRNHVALPLVQTPTAFVTNLPIWSHQTHAAAHEVNLFRYTLMLDSTLPQAEWHLFADTRYEAWLNGVRLGRGPARFSTRFREWDVLKLGTLPTGQHTLAVLVQWAPNLRRSESVAPMLVGHIQNAAGTKFFARSGADWKVVRSNAWREDAALAHTSHLIGPSEIVDFARLPENWTEANYDDSNWSRAVVLSPTSIGGMPTRPRSIPLLREERVVPRVLEVGWWSPNRFIRDLPTDGTPLTFNLDTTRAVTLETLLPVSQSLQLGDQVLTTFVRPVIRSDLRPDVVTTQLTLPRGSHALRLFSSTLATNVNAASIAISKAGVFGLPALAQGNHAGRRLLLGEPISDSTAVNFSTSVGASSNLSLMFGTQPSYAVLDLGRVRYGRLVAMFSAAPNTIIDIGWDERLLTGTQRPLPFPGTLHPEWNATDSWSFGTASNNAVRMLSTLDARSGRYMLLVSWGPAHLKDVHILEESYPVDLKGSFRSDDPELNAIWSIGVDTARINMTDGYADPWRERGQWWGDSFVVDHVNQVAFGDTDLLKRGLRLMMDGAVNGLPRSLAPHGGDNYILDYGMLWVQSLADYTARTGDKTVARESLATISEFLARLLAMEDTKTHLLNVPDGSWAKSALVDFRAHYGQVGTGARGTAGWSTPVNAMYYGTLLAAANIAAETGDFAQADAWRKQAEVLRHAINTHLYLPFEQRYASTYYNSILGQPTVYAQAWPLAYGVTPSSEITAVAQSLLNLMSNDPTRASVGPYGMFWVLEGLVRANQVDEAIRLMRLHYGYMLRLGATTWWESFNSHLSYNSALSHGWGSAPTWFLSRHVLGLKQTSPKSWQLNPRLDVISELAGDFPLTFGVVRVKWRRPTCGRILLTVESPQSSKGVVFVQLSRSNSITATLDGIKITPQLGSVPQQDGSPEYRFQLQGETLRLESSQLCSTVQPLSPAPHR